MTAATRFLLVGLALVLALTALTATAVLWQTARAAQARSSQRLQLAGAVESEFQANRLHELQLRAESLAEDPAFVDYVAQSLIPDPRRGGAIDKASISDLLRERRRGYDVAAVLDVHGAPMAASGVLLRDAAEVRTDPLVVEAIRTHKPVQGVWIDHGELLWVAINPLLRGGALRGVLVTATRIDDAFAIAVSRIARTGIVFVVQPAAAAAPAPASGVEDGVAAALVARWSDAPAPSGSYRLRLDDATHRAQAWVWPLDASGGRAAMVAVAPVATVAELASGEARPLLFGVGALGLLGVALVLMQWRRTLRPLQNMLEVVERAARTGDTHLTVRADGSRIVRALRDPINGLLQRDAAACGER